MKLNDRLLFAVAPFAVCVMVYFVAPFWLFGLITEVWLIVSLSVVLLDRRKLVLILPITVFLWAFLSVAIIGVSGRCPHGCQRDAARISSLRQVQNALERYYNKCAVYPGAVPESGSDPACGGVSRPSQLVGQLLGISNIPKDPLTGDDYSYCYTAGGASYTLQADLEDVQNAALANAPTAPPVGCKTTAGAVTCDRAKGEYCVSP